MVTLLVALWSTVAPVAQAVVSTAEVQSCCGDAAPTCCCCEDFDDDAPPGPAATTPAGCPCSAPLDAPAPESLPALPTSGDSKPHQDVATDAVAPTPAPVSELLADAPRASGVPPPGPARAVLHCSFRF